MNAFDMERVSARMRDVYIVQRDPEQAGGKLAHELLRDVDGELVGAGEAARMGREIGDGELQQLGHFVKLDLIAAELRRIERGFVVVTKQVFVLRFAGGRQCSSEQAFGQNDSGAEAGTVARLPLSPMRLNPLLGATTQASLAGRFRSLRKYSKTVGFSGATAAKLLKLSYTPVARLAVATWWPKMPRLTTWVNKVERGIRCPRRCGMFSCRRA